MRKGRSIHRQRFETCVQQNASPVMGSFSPNRRYKSTFHNTASADAGELPQPSDSDSATADDMMKFDDTELRSLITFPGMKSGSGGI